jgi:choline dehydrogenase
MNLHSTRRQFLRACARGVVLATAILQGCANRLGMAAAEAAPCAASTADEYDYVVVGSGAGGGPLAANLAMAGFKVLLIEAGGDEEPYDYQVPVFHAASSEDDDLRWSFYVRLYARDARQRRDR